MERPKKIVNGVEMDCTDEDLIQIEIDALSPHTDVIQEIQLESSAELNDRILELEKQLEVTTELLQTIQKQGIPLGEKASAYLAEKIPVVEPIEKEIIVEKSLDIK